MCTPPNVGSWIRCDTNKASYGGETVKVTKTRIKGQLDNLLKQKLGCTLIKHIKKSSQKQDQPILLLK